MSGQPVATKCQRPGPHGQCPLPGGFVQFSVVHPVLSAPAGRGVQDEPGVRRERVVGDYFSEGPLTEPWIFGAAPAEVRDRYQPFTVAYAHGP
jgi:hypothetical protein